MHDRREIQPGDSGIWATCTLGKEGKCVGDLKALFEEVSEEETRNRRLLLISGPHFPVRTTLVRHDGSVWRRRNKRWRRRSRD